MKYPSGYHIEKIEEYIPNKSIKIGEHLVSKVAINPEVVKFNIKSGVIDLKRSLVSYLQYAGEGMDVSYRENDYDKHLSDYYSAEKIPIKTTDKAIDADFHVRIGMGTIVIDAVSLSGKIGA